MTSMQQMLKQSWSRPHSELIFLHDRDIGNAEIKANTVNEPRIMNFYSCKLCLAKFANNMILLHLLILSDICIAVNNFEPSLFKFSYVSYKIDLFWYLSLWNIWTLNEWMTLSKNLKFWTWMNWVAKLLFVHLQVSH